MTPLQYYEEQLMENLEKLRDFNINIIPNKELEIYYQSWIDQVKNKNIIDKKLIKYLENQADYYGPKDRNYSKYIERLIYE